MQRVKTEFDFLLAIVLILVIWHFIMYDITQVLYLMSGPDADYVCSEYTNVGFWEVRPQTNDYYFERMTPEEYRDFCDVQ